MKTEKPIMKEHFKITKINETYTVSIRTQDYLKRLLRKHPIDKFEGSGYDWCKMLVAFMYHHELLKDLWYVFDYNPHGDELKVSTTDGDALYLLMNEFEKIYFDVDFLENLMRKIDYKRT